MEGEPGAAEPGAAHAEPERVADEGAAGVPGGRDGHGAAVAAQEAMLRRYQARPAGREEGFGGAAGGAVERRLEAGDGSLSEQELAELAAIDDPQLKADIERELWARKDAELAAGLQSQGGGGAAGPAGVSASDVALAMSLQQREIDDGRVRWRRLEAAGGGFHEVELAEVEGDLAAEVNGDVAMLRDMPCWRRCVALAAPCLLGNPCSRHRRAIMTRSWLTRFMGLFSLAQVGLLVAAVVDGGLDSSNAGLGPSPETLRRYGSTTPDMYLDREVWRMFTPIVLCPGFVHLALVLWAQMRLGVAWERDWGAGNVFVLVLVGGMNATVLSSIVQKHTLSGAGHAAFMSLAGCKLGQFYLAWQAIPSKERRANAAMVAFWVLVIAALCFVPDVFADNATTLGGLAVGFFHAISVFVDELPEDAKWRRRIFPVLGRLLMLAWVAVEILVLVDQGRLDAERVAESPGGG